MRGSRPAADAPAKREGSTTMHRRRRLAASATALAASALLLAACGSSKPSTSSTTKTKTTTSGKPTYGGTVAWAEPAGASPNYIFPVNPVQYQSVANLTDFQPLMYQGLFTSYFGEPAIDYADSKRKGCLAEFIVFAVGICCGWIGSRNFVGFLTRCLLYFVESEVFPILAMDNPWIYPPE